ncbi:hypothetical protein PTSG_07077 [Salpingoeca rosetta]|uniref:C2H2-type domain-containing protein n=1 Tax=Salpingoeca rosetta (strain ATCC 50818 / BSB-021) TaxID=946362 RepID=F2UDZ7_SALR5|nr:uncharacterized protein PTSG_07077 [Salpingoeca rosetta]EGD74847.1 hypothetical protein PTSG_07077 [Salpingoeca rosetta]|eukprot:XP_004992492.1 hypothetical protein PTSG_07077 [Salpingoeca rosetta]
MEDRSVSREVSRCEQTNEKAIQHVIRAQDALAALRQHHHATATKGSSSSSGTSGTSSTSGKSGGRRGSHSSSGESEDGVDVDEAQAVEVELRAIAQQLVSQLRWLRLTVSDPRAGAAELNRRPREEHNPQVEGAANRVAPAGNNTDTAASSSGQDKVKHGDESEQQPQAVAEVLEEKEREGWEDLEVKRLKQLIELTERNVGGALAASELLRGQLQRLGLAPDLRAVQEHQRQVKVDEEEQRQGPAARARHFITVPPFLEDSALTTVDESLVKPYICLVCDRGFGRDDLLRAHMQAHRNPEAFRCNVKGCDRAFATYKELLAHVKQPHTEVTLAAQPAEQPAKKTTMTRRSARHSGLLEATHCNCGLTKHTSKHDKCCVDDECPCVLKGVLCVACGCRHCHNKRPTVHKSGKAKVAKT